MSIVNDDALFTIFWSCWALITISFISKLLLFTIGFDGCNCPVSDVFVIVKFLLFVTVSPSLTICPFISNTISYDESSSTCVAVASKSAIAYTVFPANIELFIASCKSL